MRNEVLRSDLPWAMFYRDGLSAPDIALRLGCTMDDLMPELSAPVKRALVSYQDAIKNAALARR